MHKILEHLERHGYQTEKERHEARWLRYLERRDREGEAREEHEAHEQALRDAQKPTSAHEADRTQAAMNAYVHWEQPRGERFEALKAIGVSPPPGRLLKAWPGTVVVSGDVDRLTQVVGSMHRYDPGNKRVSIKALHVDGDTLVVSWMRRPSGLMKRFVEQHWKIEGGDDVRHEWDQP